tara:strand:- start:4535 stop:4804 length:270 start_codon:yes stop_codon:yes gene_type:complete
MFYNEKTKKPYQGSNIETLMATGLSGGFLTFCQARDLGYKIPKGTKIVAKLIQPIGEKLIEKSNGKLESKKSARRFNVFHVSQLVKETN